MTDLLPKLVPQAGRLNDISRPSTVFKSLVDTLYTFDNETSEPIVAFSTAIANLGKGRLEFLIGEERTENGERIAPAIQRIYNTEGGYREHNAGEFEFHTEADGHQHWHFKGFEFFDLLSEDGNNVVAKSKKEGFCMVDSFKLSALQDSPDTMQYTLDGCINKKIAGISIGWADVYGPAEDDQFINIKDVESGIYRLRLTANPNRSIEEEGNGMSEQIKIMIDKKKEKAWPVEEAQIA